MEPLAGLQMISRFLETQKGGGMILVKAHRDKHGSRFTNL